MNKKAPLALGISLVIISSLITPLARAQSAFSNAVMSLNPVAYWPLQETVQPPAADMEVNLGSLGAAGNAVYSSTNVTKGASPIPGDGGDFAVACSATAAGSFLAVRTAAGASTLPAGPFSVEVWVNPTNVTTVASTILAQTGPSGSGGLNGGANSAGWSLNFGYLPSEDIAMAGTISFHVYNGNGFKGGAEATFTSSSFSVGNWYHVVGVFDGTNAQVEVNAVGGLPVQAMTGTQALDTWDPLTIGCGRGLNQNKFGGSIDEVAIYTNALSSGQISTHFNAGSGGGNYANTILADHPYMYWRMDAPAHTTSNFSAYPTAFNYGTGVNINGLYLAGTTPGVAGPSFPGFASPSYACAMNGIGTDDTNAIPSFTNGVAWATNMGAQTGIIITNLLSSMNLTTNNKSFMCWFFENPTGTTANNRGGLIGHSDTGWRSSMNGGNATANTVGRGGDLNSSPLVYDDGNWHFLAAVYFNTGLTNTNGWLATNFLYVDGLQVTSAFDPTNSPGSLTNVSIGAPPDKSSGNGNSYTAQVLNGSIAHVAYFTNALSASQIMNLYTNATGGAPLGPIITGQPITGRINGAGGSNGSGVGSFLFFGVTYNSASMQPAPSLQWYYNSSSNYAGATPLVTDNIKYVATTNVGNVSSTAAQMTISNLVDSDSGYYYVVLNNGFGSTTSILASLTVKTEPFITGQTPAAGTLQLYQNQNFTLSITAGGTNIAFLWYTNGVADTTAGTAASYPLVNVQTSMSGNTYFCVASNAAGTATSGTVTLSVIPLPAALTNNTYSSNILALNPSGYWPLHETTAGVRGEVETNLGSLGNLANGYYADWVGPISNIVHGVSGALAGDNDPAVFFNNVANTATPGYLVIPRTSPATTLAPPFTLEAWVKPDNSGFGDIISQGPWGANANGTSGPRSGIRMCWSTGASGANAAADFAVFVGPGTTANPSFPATIAKTYTIGQWYHVALSTADGTNWLFYVNGSQHYSFALPMAVDSGDPIVVGQGLWQNNGPQRGFPGAIDEVAIYTNVLDPGEISRHYNIGAGFDTSATYKQAVLETNPVVYLRMDAPAYTAPPISSWSVATNYGTAAGNGVYSPGSLPGIVSGPVTTGIAGNKVMPGNGMSSFADVGNNAAFNPTGATAFSYGAWFQGNPTDARSFQTVMGRSDMSFRTAINAAGKLQAHAGGVDVTSPTIVNDGLWHQFIITFTGTNVIYNGTNTATNGINTLYVDGVQVGQTTGPANPGTNLDVMIGDDPGNTNNPVGTGRCVQGQICEAAFWNGVTLSSNQVLALFNVSQIGPQITKQPVSASVNELASFTNSVTVIGSAPLSYQWYRDGLPLPIGGQTNLPIGATNSTLPISPVKATDASTDYYVVISNSGGSVTSSVVSLTVFTEPVFTNEPVLITQTNNILLFAGATPTFKVGTVGAVPTFYQWYTNGVAATLQATNLTSYAFSTTSGATNFYCVASNFVGVTTDTLVFVTVLNDPTAPYPVSVLSANPLGYWRLNEPDNTLGNHNAGVIADDYWGAFNGIYTNADLGQSGYNPGTDPSETSVQFGFDAFVDGNAFGIGGIDFSAPATNSVGFTVEAWVNGFAQSKDAGIVSKGFGGGEQFNLDCGSDNVVQGGVTNQHCFRFFVRDASGATHGANSKILPNGSWHHLVGVCDELNSNVTLYVDGAVAGSTSISPGSGILASSRLMLIGSRPSNSTTNHNDLQFVGTIDDVAVYNYALSANQIAAQYSSAGVAPNLTQAPATNVSVNGFGALTLPAGAVGTPALGYAWYDTFGGTNLATGSTNQVPLNATLNIASVPPSWNGDTFELTVSNTYGMTNYLFTLTVFTNAPVFTLDLPPQVHVVSGKAYTYFVTAVGAQPLYLQWYNGATLLTGQTNTSLSVVAGSPGSTTYYVVATNAFGTTTSTISTFTSVAQVGGYAYATNVLALNPAGYWPLQESNAPARVTIETNYGSLGTLGTAYYVINNASSQVTFGQGGALTGSGDNDAAVAFAGGGSTGYAVVPRASPSLTLAPPFTIECWAIPPGFDTFGDIVGDRGTSLDSSAAGVSSGVCVFWEHNPSQFSAFVGDGSTQTEIRQSALPTENQWHHLVLTCDAGTNFVLYVDGVADGSATLNYVPSLWNPLTIGAGFWDLTRASVPFRFFQGSVDDVAIYSNALSATEINNHYLSGITPGSNYVQAVQFDQPQLYYRMDCSGFTNTPETSCPEAINYGSAAPNGFYLPGVPPGALTGPTNGNLASNVVAAPINGVFSCVDAGSDPSFNPSGNQSFSAITWFRTYPADSRVQTIMSHGITNWAMNLDGTTGKLVWNLFSGGSQVTSTNILNDGNWHFIAGVFDGSTSNSYLYVDGQLNASLKLTNAVPSEANAHLYLGGNSDAAQIGVSERFFAGALAQAAFFSSALSAAQVQSLYVATITPTNPSTNATITKVFLSGTNVVVLGTNNNVPNTSFHYAVLVSTNIATPLSNWLMVVTNAFNPDGTFNYTNPIIPGTPRQFIDVKAVP